MRVRTPVASVFGSGGSAGPGAPGLTAGQPPSRDLGRRLIGLVVVTLGVLLLLDTAGVLRADRIIDHWWPVAVIAAGALTLAERPRAAVRGAVRTGVGVLLLLFSTHALDDAAWNYVWPIALIVVGLVIVARGRGRAMPKGVVADDVIRSTAVFSGSELGSSAPVLRGAWLTAVFGGIALDLRDSRLGLDAVSIFGCVSVTHEK